MPTQALIRSFVEASPNLAWANWPDGTTQFVNARFVEYSGYSAEQVTAAIFSLLVHPDDVGPALLLRGENIAAERAYCTDVRLRRADGAYRWHSAHVAPLRDAAGRVVSWYGSAIDIHDRRLQEEARREAEERFRVLFSSSAIGVIRAEFGDARLVDLNEAFCRMLGYSREELIGRSWREFMFPEDIDPGPLAAMSRDELESYVAEKRFRRRDGSTIWIRTTVSMVRDGQGRPECAVGVATDLTDRKQAEDALRESEARFRAVFQSAAIGVARVGFEGARWLEVNDAFCRILGYSRRELIGSAWPSITHPDDVDTDLKQFERMARGDIESYTVEKRFLHKTGGPVWARLTLSLVRDAFGKPDFEVCLVEDITDRKQAEEAARASEAQFQTLANSIPQVAWMADAAGSIFWYNDRWHEFSGVTREEMKREGWRSLVHPDHSHRVLSKLRESFEAGERWEDVFPMRLGQDGWRWFLFRAIPVFDSDGGIVRWFGTGTDITRQREAQESLRLANEDLQRFSYVVSHDLKEPLRQVAAFSQLLAREYAGAEGGAKEYAEYIVNGTARMNNIIRDLLAMADSERQLPLECFESGDALNDALQAVGHHLHEVGGKVIVDEKLPKVLAPRPVVRQAFQNLLSNAIKYRRQELPPEIHVRGHRGDGICTFSVSDNGQGIPPEFQERLFQWFARVPGTKAIGNGIGLASVERMLQRIGGRIWVDSEPGAGSTFHFTVPASDGADC